MSLRSAGNRKAEAYSSRLAKGNPRRARVLTGSGEYALLCHVEGEQGGSRTMPTTTQLVIREVSKPGVLAQVAAILAEAGVNIEALSAPEGSGHGNLRIIVADLERARTALKSARVRFREEPALILSLHNRPGALSEVVDHLKRARINIKCGYCTPSREGKRAIVVLTVSNTQRALDLLR